MKEKQIAPHAFVVKRAVLTAALTVLPLMTMVLFSPTARAFAAEKFRQISAFIFEMEPAGSSPAVAPTVPAPVAAQGPEAALNLEEAAALAGFPVRLPAYLPPGFAMERGWSIDQRASGTYGVSTYRHPDGRFLILNQTAQPSDISLKQPIGQNEQIVDTVVNGADGIFISGRLMADPVVTETAEDIPLPLVPTNWLVWQSGEITYTLLGSGLGQREMIAVAESLTSE